MAPPVVQPLPSTTRQPGFAALGGPRRRPSAAAHLSDADVAELGKELDAIREEVLASRGAADAAYIRSVIKVQRIMELLGRGLLVVSVNPVAFVAGSGILGAAKILENMEIGHNVLHGQWDWMRDPDIHSTTWEWDFVAPAKGWKHTHNDLHHTWTNVIGRDSDVGYDLLRMSEDQPWTKKALFNVPLNMILSPFFEWGIDFYDLEVDRLKAGEKSREDYDADMRDLKIKAFKQALKDYAATPLMGVFTGSALPALAGTFVANTIRNVWAHAVIFCGHFPEGADTFTEDMVRRETRSDWYIRQMLGSANISGGPLMHIMTGNLSHQIEHHLFPDIPSRRYGQIAPRVRDICRRYQLPYTTGPLYRQVALSWKRVFQMSFPPKRTSQQEPAPKAPAG
ncbi:MAG TPA: acyl-CoA desaturase [Dermatophilaceae bacterium]|nr:acyl-CoA desaturase [Dermatophilaceae bacterium]